MSVLILRLKGPQQSWGTSSRYRTREAGTEPSKSGVIGLLAAAQGRSRESELTDLLELGFGVRADQPGRLMVDYHTARVRGAKNSSLSSRHYRVDAAYTAAISGPDSLVASLAEAIDSPRFPLYLGRRACPAPVDLLGGVLPGGDVEAALRDVEATPWLASEWYRKESAKVVYLPLARDARSGEVGETVQDVPVSFDPRHRLYDARAVVRPTPVRIENPDGVDVRDDFFQTVKEG
ncbi:MAG: type I-E CRISPR-associated protein Cas5/CasD [Kocuria sp.]|uniref:type I-E CRISPR-associated protein Cas5/CasD n=1 Tax=Kocuria TaxID=57493 RepID=UPI0006D77237|nr:MULTISPECIES: type I-E CRISPR-associated protein Cas5/CasD [Kocuria]MDO4257410.1 type I-E CRISPR-associated protein Cas5/CasD [Kocuria sp.]